MQSEARLHGLQNCGLERYKALVQTTVSGKGGVLNETNFQYSIISPPILLAKPNRQKGGA